MSLQPAATFVNYVYTIKIKQLFRRLGIPRIVIFPRSARKPANSNGCGLLPWKGSTPMIYLLPLSEG
jgi:hypothetical protein